MIRSLRRLSRFFVLAFVLVAGGLGYWGVINQDALTSRQDNPRRVVDEQKIRQGDILDRSGGVVVTSVYDGSRGTYARQYLHPEAAVVVGYYSLRHGTGGIESTFASTLHGDRFLTPAQVWADALLHRSQAGGDIQLTISLPLQAAARNALLGQRGAVVVIDAASGDILAMDSLPTYDPNTLDETWDQLKSDPAAPLLNRATQALYQPGSVLQSVVLGEAINTGAAKPGDAWSGLPSARFGNSSLPCASDTGFAIKTYGDAFLWGCPGAFQTLGARMGISDVRHGFEDFALAEAPAFDLPVAAASAQGLPPDDDPAIAAIGQGRLTVTPLHMALVASAFANRGQMPVPRLVSAIRPPGQSWQPVAEAATPRGTISGDSADLVKEWMRRAVALGAAQAAYSHERVVYGHAGLALAGPGFAINTWFIGFTYDDRATPIAVAVLLENSADTERAARLGGQLLLDAASISGK